MHVCTRAFSALYGDEHITIAAGEFVASDHELVTRVPEAFEPEEIADRRAAVQRAAADPANHEAGAVFHTERSSDRREQDATRSRALRANERASFLPERAREHMETQLREDDGPTELTAQATIALSDRAYLRAFAKVANDPISGGHEWTDDEREAVQRVKWLQRSMNLGTTTAGGFLVPYELDPQILIAGVGAVSPLREISRVVTTTQNEKRFVTSLGETSTWTPEEQEQTDDAPALLQPAITCKKGAAFVPVSYELFEDYFEEPRAARSNPQRAR